MRIIDEGKAFGQLPFLHFCLDNQLEVVLVQNREAAVAACQLQYKVGSALEEEDEQGMAHFFEHMMFRETEHLADGAFDHKIAEMGGVGLNAYTSYDVTAYHVSVPSTQLGGLLELEAERMVHLHLTEPQVEAERGAVLGEMRMLADQPSEQLWNGVMQSAYQHHPYRRPIVGQLEQVERFAPADFERFYRKHYTPQNAVLTLVGGFDMAQTQTLVEQVFADLSNTPTPGAPAATKPMAEPAWQQTKQRVLLQPKVSAPTLVLAWRAPNTLALKENAALLLMLAHLNAGNASPIQQRLIQQGPCISASLSHLGLEMQLRDAGLLLFEAELRQDHTFEQAKACLFECLEECQSSAWDAQLLQRAYNQLRLQHYTIRHSNTAMAEQVCAGATTLNNPWFGEQLYDAAQATTPQQAKQALQNSLLDAAHLCVAQVPNQKKARAPLHA